MKKLPPKFTPIVFGLFMSILMASLMSFVLTSYYTGFTPGLLHRWWHSFTIAWPVALPSIMVISPIVRRIVFGLVGDADATPHAPQALKMPIGFTLFNILFTILLIYSIYFASFVKSQQVSIKALTDQVTELNQKMAAIQASEDETLKALSKLNDIETKIDAQKLELDEIKELLKSAEKHQQKSRQKLSR
jgi:cell division protein FtsB